MQVKKWKLFLKFLLNKKIKSFFNRTEFTPTVHAKGQIISKAICVFLTSPKNERKIEKIWLDTTMTYQVTSFSFVF